ncbi:hypothetical protein MPER_12488 [Moniliophthora perniciosa FA553]|nr:hypothetical protein MPER_12488 [Moniliophthora perniciosa FA553]
MKYAIGTGASRTTMQVEYEGRNLAKYLSTLKRDMGQQRQKSISAYHRPGTLAEIPFDKKSTTVMDFVCGLAANVLEGLSSDKVRGIRKELKGEPRELDDAKLDVVVCSDPATLLDITKTLTSFIQPGGHLVIVDNEPTTANTAQADGDLPKHTIGKSDGFTSAEMEKLFTGAGLLSFTYHHLTQFERRDGVNQRVFLAKAQKPLL